MGSKIAYYLLLYPLSLLPHRILYLLSDFMYLIMHYAVGYRDKVVMTNLKNSFPNKTEQELKDYKKEYYHHMCDLIVESIKNISISEAQLKKRFTFENSELLEELYATGKSIVIIGGHYGNWERYAIATGHISQHKQYTIYKPIKNKFFNVKTKEMRERFGQQMISMLMTKKYFIKNPEQLKCITFAADQWTSNPKAAYWSTFLQQDTPFFNAAERLAKQFDWAVVYIGISKPKRGYYRATYELITDQSQTTQEGEIMESFIQKLETSIHRNPPHWLWSHRRWKKTKAEVFGSGGA